MAESAERIIDSMRESQWGRPGSGWAFEDRFGARLGGVLASATAEGSSHAAVRR